MRYNASIIVLIILSVAISGTALPVAASKTQSRPEERININSASIEELTKLPGIGPALAARIVEHRRKHGPFKRPQEVIIVQGMSAKRYRRIAHLIRI